jgi:hypothetical protein
MTAFDPKRTFVSSGHSVAEADFGLNLPGYRAKCLNRSGGVMKKIARNFFLSWMVAGVFSAYAQGNTTYNVTYVPNTVKLDARTAQDEVRVLLMTADIFKYANGTPVTLTDVRFRPEGMAIMIEYEGKQVMRACYYAAIDPDLNVVKSRDNFYATGYMCPNQAGVAFFKSEEKAKRLADALFALKNAPH